MKKAVWALPLLALLLWGCGAGENVFKEGDKPGRGAEELLYEAKSLQEKGALEEAAKKAEEIVQNPQAPEDVRTEAERVAGESLIDLSGLNVPVVVADVKEALEEEAGKVDESDLVSSVVEVGPEGIRWKVDTEKLEEGVEHLDAFQQAYEREHGRPEPNVALTLAVSKGVLAAKKLLDIFDLNGDGNVTPEEVVGTFDTNGDGVVSREELQAGADKVAQIASEQGLTGLLREALDDLEDAIEAGQVSPDDPLARLLRENKQTILDVLDLIDQAGGALDPEFVDRVLDLIPAR